MISREKYREFCQKESSIPIFSQAWWLDAVCGKDNWSVILIEKGGKICASMPYYIKKKYGQTIIKHPLLTQTLGIYFKYPTGQKYSKKLSFEKDMINQIVDQLPKFDKFTKSFNYKITNLLPFHWREFSINVDYTYTIESISMEELEKTLETNTRGRIRKAIKYGVEVYESDDIKKFYELNKMTFVRQQVDIPYSFEFINNLYQKCKEHNACKIYFAKDSSGFVIACNFLIYDETKVYYLMGGIDPSKKDLGGMDIIQYESIKFALKNNKVFDFEGSMIESLEKYTRGFGAIQKPYFRVTKVNSKLLKLQEFLKER